ncbi:hypothetical protein ACHAWF_010547 [Thalassiosira exigua]
MSSTGDIHHARKRKPRPDDPDQNGRGRRRRYPPPPSSAAGSSAPRRSPSTTAPSPSAAAAASGRPGKKRPERPPWVPSRDAFPWSSAAATYGSCPDVSSRYEKIGRIGEGTYAGDSLDGAAEMMSGVVYQARDKQTGDVVALKRCLPHHEASDGFPLTTLREITILRELQSDGGQRHGIVGLRGVTVSSSRSGVFLVFEYAQHDLASLVDDHYAKHRRGPFGPAEVKRLALQLLDAIRFLHARCVLHRDLKLSNLLYNHRGELRVADFGLARRVGGEYVRGRESRRRGTPVGDVGEPLTPKVASLWYRPPELLLGSERYDQGVDTWAAGCVVGELLRGKPLMDGRNEMEQIQKMFDFLGPPNVNDWPDLKNMPIVKDGDIKIPKRWQVKNDGRHMLDVFRDLRSPPTMKLLAGLLRYDPAVRWTAEEALAVEYFTTLLDAHLPHQAQQKIISGRRIGTRPHKHRLGTVRRRLKIEADGTPPPLAVGGNNKVCKGLVDSNLDSVVAAVTDPAVYGIAPVK